MHYPVWTYCCKRPNYYFCISQGSVATVLKWGGQTIVIYVKSLHDVPCQKLFKSANVSRSYSKNNNGTVFFRDMMYLVTDVYVVFCAIVLETVVALCCGWPVDYQLDFVEEDNSVVFFYSCLDCLLTVGVKFQSYSTISHAIAHCPHHVPVKEFWKFVKDWQRYEQKLCGTFFYSPKYVCEFV